MIKLKRCQVIKGNRTEIDPNHAHRNNNLPRSDTVLGTKKGKYTDERNFT